LIRDSESRTASGLTCLFSHQLRARACGARAIVWRRTLRRSRS
jgi:hypothetical protein